jgi:hypothetical protein
MSEHEHLRVISSNNEHPPCSLFVSTLLVGESIREKFPKWWRVCQIQRYTLERAWNSLLVFVVRESVFLLLLKKTFKYCCVGICVSNTDYCFLSAVLLCVLMQDMREFFCVIAG